MHNLGYCTNCTNQDAYRTSGQKRISCKPSPRATCTVTISTDLEVKFEAIFFDNQVWPQWPHPEVNYCKAIVVQLDECVCSIPNDALFEATEPRQDFPCVRIAYNRGRVV